MSPKDHRETLRTGNCGAFCGSLSAQFYGVPRGEIAAGTGYMFSLQCLCHWIWAVELYILDEKVKLQYLPLIEAPRRLFWPGGLDLGRTHSL